MRKNRFIRERAFTIHQMILLIGFSAISLQFFLQLMDYNLTLSGYLTAAFFLTLTLYLLGLAFSKKTLIKKESKLYKGKSIFGILLTRRKIKLNDRPVVSILKFKKKQKFAFVSAASPDQADAFNSFELFVLNEKHTQRDSVVYFSKEHSAEEAVAFLTQDFPLRHEIFSPDFD